MTKVIVFAVLLFAISAMTSAAMPTDYGLRTACAPMQLVVESLGPEDTRQTGLTEEAIMNAAESRLRAARLFVPFTYRREDREQYLYINVNIVGHAFGISISLRRYLDLGYGWTAFAIVWRTGSVGTRSGDGQYILGVVSKYLDEFIASYLRVNEEHCSR